MEPEAQCPHWCAARVAETKTIPLTQHVLQELRSVLGCAETDKASILQYAVGVLTAADKSAAGA